MSERFLDKHKALRSALLAISFGGFLFATIEFGSSTGFDACQKSINNHKVLSSATSFSEAQARAIADQEHPKFNKYLTGALGKSGTKDVSVTFYVGSNGQQDPTRTARLLSEADALSFKIAGLSPGHTEESADVSYSPSPAPNGDPLVVQVRQYQCD